MQYITMFFQYTLLAMMLVGVPIVIFEGKAGRTENVVQGQQAMLITAAILIWYEVLR